jgi:transposase-like protein
MDKNYFTKRRNYQLYPESIKKAVVLEYESSDCSQAYLSRKYGIGSRTIILHWLKKYGNNSYLSIPEQPQKSQPDMAEDTPEIRALKARIKQLERELEDSKLLAEAYSLMITTAEEQLKIPIRKKFNTK